MSTVKVEYVGKKEQRADTVAGTGLVWYGAGDVHDVPVEAALKLSRHPDVWRVLQEDGPITTADMDKALSTLDSTEALIGTDKLPDLVDITDTQQAQLGDLVRGAFEGSDMTVEEWNALEADVRDELILGFVEKVRADFNKPPEATSKPEAKKTAAKKTAPAKKAAKGR